MLDLERALRVFLTFPTNRSRRTASKLHARMPVAEAVANILEVLGALRTLSHCSPCSKGPQSLRDSSCATSSVGLACYKATPCGPDKHPRHPSQTTTLLEADSAMTSSWISMPQAQPNSPGMPIPAVYPESQQSYGETTYNPTYYPHPPNAMPHPQPSSTLQVPQEPWNVSRTSSLVPSGGGSSFENQSCGEYTPAYSRGFCAQYGKASTYVAQCPRGRKNRPSEGRKHHGSHGGGGGCCVIM